MEEALRVLSHVPSVMLVLLLAGLIMGQRHVGELSVFDLLTGIAIGAVAGAGIVDPKLSQILVITAMLGLAALHYGFTWVVRTWPAFARATTFEPTIVVKHGQPLRQAMRRVQFSVGDLLPLLREKDIFDLKEVQYAILEPDGKLTVLKEGSSQAAKGLPRAVCIDGKIEVGVLEDLGWDELRLRHELIQRGLPAPEKIFLATLDDAGNLYVAPREGEQKGPQIKH
ncbi:MAG: DUF421 domain-containing protein [Bacillota bacterium]